MLSRYSSALFELMYLVDAVDVCVSPWLLLCRVVNCWSISMEILYCNMLYQFEGLM